MSENLNILTKKQKKKLYDQQRYLSTKEQQNERSREWYKKNKDRVAEERRIQATEWRRNNPDKAKDAYLKRKYNISLEEYQQLLQLQNYVCAICKEPESKVDHKAEKTNSLTVDHCHKTGEIRGLLCDRCNRAIGLFHDDPKLLEFATNYLRTEI